MLIEAKELIDGRLAFDRIVLLFEGSLRGVILLDGDEKCLLS